MEWECTCLLTREEYAAFEKAAADRRHPLLYSAAAALALMGAALWALEGELTTLAGLLLPVAVGLIAGDRWFLPALASGEAARRYTAVYGGRMAQMVRFSDDSVWIRTDRAEGTVPLALCSRVLRCKTGVRIEFGREIVLCLPYRALTAEQAAALTTLKGNNA